MVGENYLHVRRWKANFVAESAVINSMPVWVRFPSLPVEYFTESWLRKARDQIGRTIKVDSTTLAVVRGRFARVCVKVDLNKPLHMRQDRSEQATPFIQTQGEGMAPSI